MLSSAVAAWLMLFILGVSTHFICPYPGCFSFWITPVFSPGHTPNRRNTVFPPDTIPLQDSSPFLSAPTYHPRELPYTLHSEILCLPINPLTAIHICHFHSYNLIFLLSLHDSPFQISPCLPSTGACHAPVLIIKEEFTIGNSPALLVCPDTLFSPVPVLPLSEQF